MKGYKSINVEPDEWQRVGNDTTAIVIGCLLLSLFVHEIGHALAFNLLGISTTFFFEIRVAGPVLGVRVPYLPTTLPGMVFAIAAGGGFAAIVFALLGRLWRIDCYVVAVFQACYVPFELMTWILGLQTAEELSVFFWFFALVPIPTAIIADRIFDRIVKEGA